MKVSIAELQLGVVCPRGQHVRGSHNALLKLGRGTYLSHRIDPAVAPRGRVVRARRARQAAHCRGSASDTGRCQRSWRTRCARARPGRDPPYDRGDFHWRYSAGDRLSGGGVFCRRRFSGRCDDGTVHHPCDGLEDQVTWCGSTSHPSAFGQSASWAVRDLRSWCLSTSRRGRKFGSDDRSQPAKPVE